MDEKIEITEKAVRKSAGQERAFVDMLNQEVKELKENMQLEEITNVIENSCCHMTALHSYSTKCGKCIAETIIAKGYRKESDTAREILSKLLNMGERAILNDIINPYECFFVSFDKFKKIAEKYGVDLGE